RVSPRSVRFVAAEPRHDTKQRALGDSFVYSVAPGQRGHVRRRHFIRVIGGTTTRCALNAAQAVRQAPRHRRMTGPNAVARGCAISVVKGAQQTDAGLAITANPGNVV